MDIKEAYKIMQDNCGIEVGDTVEVLREAKDYEMGWSYVWTPSMTDNIGEEVEVTGIREGSNGIELNNGCAYPFFVLELIKKKEIEPDLPAHVQDIINNGNFGCYKESVENLVREILRK